MSSIRRLDESDYDQLLALWRDAGLDSIRPNGRDSREAFRRQMEQGQVVFGLHEGSRLVGAVVVTHDTRKGWVNRLAIAPDCRRRGLGAEMLRAAEAEMKRLGLQLYAALIEDYNDASISLFQKAGYILDRGVLYVSKRESPES